MEWLSENCEYDVSRPMIRVVWHGCGKTEDGSLVDAFSLKFFLFRKHPGLLCICLEFHQCVLVCVWLLEDT